MTLRELSTPVGLHSAAIRGVPNHVRCAILTQSLSLVLCGRLFVENWFFFFFFFLDVEEVLQADGVDFVKPLQGATPARSITQLLHGPIRTACCIRSNQAQADTECTGKRVSTFFFGRLPPILWLEINTPETVATHSTKRLLDQKVEPSVFFLPCRVRGC